MSIPDSCTVLVIGGGPGGSYTAAALAREGTNTVLLEADVFPRYHIGESLLPSFRYFLRFIDLESTFDNAGFVKKNGAVFKIHEANGEAYTDFIAANGPNSHSWNVIRSQADEILFKYAAECGAQVFDGTKVDSVAFDPPIGSTATDVGRPVSAKWSRKDGSSGTIKFDYLVDASGRAGVVTNKCLKIRKFNEGLKNVASWSYWKGVDPYGIGGAWEGQAYFEALDDGSGWCWAIPLSDGTMSIGVVMDQELFRARKKALGSPPEDDLYRMNIELAPRITARLKNAEKVGTIKSASDYSYSSPFYASPYLRIVGDAGCFIDPYFSSGVHLAISSALSAAMTIQAARRGDCDEATAAKWHTDKVAEGYTIFLIVVLITLKQIRAQTEPILSDMDEDGFERAFAAYRPIIQGTAEASISGKLTQEEVSRTVEFCMLAMDKKPSPEEVDKVLEKVSNDKNFSTKAKTAGIKLTDDEIRILQTVQARKMMQCEQSLNISHFAKEEINGFMPRLETGQLGLIKVSINGFH